MIQRELIRLTDDLALFETYPDNNGIKRYFVYDIKTDILTELIKTEYCEYRQDDAWTNLVADENHIKYIIDACKTTISERLQVKEITNETSY